MDLTFPNNPSLNQTHTFAGKTWRYNGTAWDAVLEVGGGGSGTVRYTIGTTAPTNPVTGDKWFNTSLGLELTYLEDDWVAVNAAQGNETTWNRNDETTESVGGIPQGTTFSLGTSSTAILEQLLYPYQNVSFSAFGIGISNREVGNTFQSSSTFSWTATEPTENWVAGSISISGPDGGLTSGLNYNSPDQVITHGPYNSPTRTSKTFTITGSQTQGSNPTRSSNFQFRYRYYVGKTGAGFVGPGLTGQGFTETLSRTTPIGFSNQFNTDGAGNTAYFVYPVKDFESFDDRPNPYLEDFDTSQDFGTLLGNTFNHVNEHGVEVTYRILMSANGFGGVKKLTIRER